MDPAVINVVVVVLNLIRNHRYLHRSNADDTINDNVMPHPECTRLSKKTQQNGVCSLGLFAEVIVRKKSFFYIQTFLDCLSVLLSTCNTLGLHVNYTGTGLNRAQFEWIKTCQKLVKKNNLHILTKLPYFAVKSKKMPFPVIIQLHVWYSYFIGDVGVRRGLG